MKDNIGQDIKQGDIVVYIRPGYKKLRTGVILKITDKGNATIAFGVGKNPWVDYTRPNFVKMPDSALVASELQEMNEIRKHYGYTRD